MIQRLSSSLLTTTEAAALLRLKPHSLENMRCDGTGPLYRKHGNRVFYHRAELNAWSKGRRLMKTSGEKGEAHA
ncbi:MAG: helix-turn-helix domain-containing protein [Thermomicrobiales bacterium]